MEDKPKRFLRLPQVRSETGLSTTQIYRGMNEGWFPANFPITKQSVAWASDEIEAWKAQKLAARARVHEAA